MSNNDITPEEFDEWLSRPETETALEILREKIREENMVYNKITKEDFEKQQGRILGLEQALTIMKELATEEDK